MLSIRPSNSPNRNAAHKVLSLFGRMHYETLNPIDYIIRRVISLYGLNLMALWTMRMMHLS